MNHRDSAVEQGRKALSKIWRFRGDELTLREWLVQQAMSSLRSGPSWPSPKVVSERVIDAAIPELYAVIRREIEEQLPDMIHEEVAVERDEIRREVEAESEATAAHVIIVAARRFENDPTPDNYDRLLSSVNNWGNQTFPLVRALTIAEKKNLESGS